MRSCCCCGGGGGGLYMLLFLPLLVFSFFFFFLIFLHFCRHFFMRARGSHDTTYAVLVKKCVPRPTGLV